MTKITLDKSSYEDLRKDMTKAQQRVEELERQLTKAGTAAQQNPLNDIVDIADIAYRQMNAKALAAPTSLEAPSGDEPEIRPVRNFLNAFESILDGLDEALNGFKRGGFVRRGLRENAEYYHTRLAEQAADKGRLFTDAGAPASEEIGFLYDRWIETVELIRRLEEVETLLLRAYDTADTGDNEGYVPKEERINRNRKVREERAAKAEQIADKMAELLKAAPALDLRRAG